MKINLTTLPILWINRNVDTGKGERMQRLFEKHGFKNHNRITAVEGIGHDRDSVVASGCGSSHIQALEYALKKYPCQQPILILEDDAEMCQHWTSDFDVPDDSDCIYLGISQWGINPTFARQSQLVNPTRAELYDNAYYRISGMLSTHAILYISAEYKRQAIELIKSASWHCDIALANRQHFHKVYTPIKPFFYQADDPNRSVTINPLFFNEKSDLQPVFSTSWRDYYNDYYDNQRLELSDIIFI